MLAGQMNYSGGTDSVPWLPSRAKLNSHRSRQEPSERGVSCRTRENGVARTHTRRRAKRAQRDQKPGCHGLPRRHPHPHKLLPPVSSRARDRVTVARTPLLGEWRKRCNRSCQRGRFCRPRSPFVPAALCHQLRNGGEDTRVGVGQGRKRGHYPTDARRVTSKV